MAEEIIGGGNGDKEKEPQPLVMTITMYPDKPLDVHAPGDGRLYNEMVCIYMLDKAKDLIKAHNRRMNIPTIQRPQFMPGIRNKIKGAFGHNG